MEDELLNFRQQAAGSRQQAAGGRQQATGSRICSRAAQQQSRPFPATVAAAATVAVAVNILKISFRNQKIILI